MTRNTLPVHPRTGLRAVGIVNGKAVWPIRGGAPTRIEEIDERLDAIRAEILEIQELTEPTDEDVARTDTLLDERDTLGTEREPLAARAVRVEAVRTAAQNPANVEPGAVFGANVNIQKDPFEEIEKIVYMPETAVRSLALTAFGDDVKLRGLSDDQHEALVGRIENESKLMRGISSHVLLHGSPAYRSAFDQWFEASKSGSNPVFTQSEADAVRAAMALGGSTGGYVLPTLLDPTLIHTGTATRNPVRSVARVIEGTQNVWHGVSVGNVTAYWTAEAGTTAEGSPTFSNPSVTAGKLTAYLAASYEIFEDSDLQGQLPGLIGEAFDYKEGTAFISGSGTNAPKGIVTAISGTAGDTVTCTTRGSFTSASAVDVFALLAAVPSRYEDSVSWLANKSWFNTVKQMSTGGQGSYFWTDFNNAVVPGAQPLLGSPVVQASDMNTSFASGSVIAILGDFSQYVIYDRIGTSVEFIQNVIDQATGLPTQQRGLVAHKRVGADVTDLGAFRFLKA